MDKYLGIRKYGGKALSILQKKKKQWWESQNDIHYLQAPYFCSTNQRKFKSQNKKRQKNAYLNPERCIRKMPAISQNTFK